MKKANDRMMSIQKEISTCSAKQSHINESINELKQELNQDSYKFVSNIYIWILTLFFLKVLRKVSYF